MGWAVSNKLGRGSVDEIFSQFDINSVVQM